MFIDRLGGGLLFWLGLVLHAFFTFFFFFFGLFDMEPYLTETVLCADLIGHFDDDIILVDSGVVDVPVVKGEDGPLAGAHEGDTVFVLVDGAIVDSFI